MHYPASWKFSFPKIYHKFQENDTDVTTEDEMKTSKNYNNNSSSSNKNLRFFGDTDLESVSSVIQQSNHPTLRRYKSNNNSTTSSSNRLQVPSRNMGGGLRHHRSTGDVATSSAESTTEGDSSQQSQRSVVYLHAATGESQLRIKLRTICFSALDNHGQILKNLLNEFGVQLPSPTAVWKLLC